jgi:hypothetical protein
MSTNNVSTVKPARVGTIIESPKPLPDSITTHAFCFLSISDFSRVSRVCKTWNEFTTSNTRIWRSVNLKKLFPLLLTPKSAIELPPECPCANKTIVKATVLFLRRIFKTGEAHEEGHIIYISSQTRSIEQKKSDKEDYKTVVTAKGGNFRLDSCQKKDAAPDETTIRLQKYLKPIFEACIADVNRTNTTSPILIRGCYLAQEYPISVLRVTNKDAITFLMPVLSPWAKEEADNLLNDDWSCMVDGIPIAEWVDPSTEG